MMLGLDVAEPGEGGDAKPGEPPPFPVPFLAGELVCGAYAFAGCATTRTAVRAGVAPSSRSALHVLA
jgi:hypothetical protein